MGKESPSLILNPLARICADQGCWKCNCIEGAALHALLPFDLPKASVILLPCDKSHLLNILFLVVLRTEMRIVKPELSLVEQAHRVVLLERVGANLFHIIFLKG